MSRPFNLKFMRYAVDHMNDDHSDATLVILKGYTQATWITKAIMESYDLDQMLIRGEDDDSTRSELFQIPFPNQLANAKEFRPVLIAMLKQYSSDKPT